MKRRDKETIALFIARIIKTAFKEAEAGHEREAKKLWNQAVAEGWKPSPRSAKGFELALIKAASIKSPKDDG